MQLQITIINQIVAFDVLLLQRIRACNYEKLGENKISEGGLIFDFFGGNKSKKEKFL